MGIKLRTKKVEQWITKELDGDMAKFLVSPLSPKEASKLLKECRKFTWQKGQRFEDTDFYAFKIGKLDRTVKDWDGVLTEDGTALPCTRDNKILIYECNPEFIDSVLEDADELFEVFKESEEEKEANL